MFRWVSQKWYMIHFCVCPKTDADTFTCFCGCHKNILIHVLYVCHKTDADTFSCGERVPLHYQLLFIIILFCGCHKNDIWYLFLCVSPNWCWYICVWWACTITLSYVSKHTILKSINELFAFVCLSVPVLCCVKTRTPSETHQCGDAAKYGSGFCLEA